MKGLHIYGVSHFHGDKQILDNASLLVPAGELSCLLGPSGCGKTTLLRLAAGLERLQTGKILIDDVVVADEILHEPTELRGIGLMFQDYALFPHLNILDNVTFGIRGVSSPEVRRRAMEMLDQVSMTDHALKHPHMLSGGQQQRVALARALAPFPKLLLLDEPFSGLDASMREQIREETLNVLKQSGVATVMVTHDPEEAMFMADRIKILGSNGRMLQSGRPHDIYFHPQHRLVAKMFGLMNRFETVIDGGCVNIPLGRIHAPGFEEGQKVEVLVRPEGITLDSNGGDGVPVEVQSTHLLGHDNIVRLRLTIDIENSIINNELYVRVHHAFEPELSRLITAGVDPKYTFIFALENKCTESTNLAISSNRSEQHPTELMRVENNP